MRWKVSFLAILTLLFLIHTASAATVTNITWYQVQGTHLKQANFVTPNVPYLAVIHIHSNTTQTVQVQVRADIVDWFDQVIASKYVTLHAGDNVVKIPFTFHHASASSSGNPYTGIRGIFVTVSGIYNIQDVSTRFRLQDEVTLSTYYWSGLLMYVDGKQYDPDAYAPVYIGSTVRMMGYLVNGSNGKPAPNFKIKWTCITGQTSTSYTNSMGFFEKVTTAPDWAKYHLCGMKARYYKISAINSKGQEVAVWGFTCTCVCQEKPKSTGHYIVKRIDVVPKNPRVKQSVYIYGVIYNAGENSPHEKVRLYINNIQKYGVWTVCIPPHKKDAVRWKYTFLYPGKYVLTVTTQDSSLSKTIVVSNTTNTTPTPTPTPTNKVPTEYPSAKLGVNVVGYSVAVAVFAVLAALILRE